MPSLRSSRGCVVDRNVASSLGWRGIHPYREAGSGSPGTVTGGADDSALVNVAGADKAFGHIVSTYERRRDLAVGCRRYLEST